MKNILIIVVGLFLLFSAAAAMAEDKPESVTTDSTTVVADETKPAPVSDQVVVYYLHMNRRCATCGKLEAYSREAVEAGFAEQLKDSSIVFRVENFETEGNEHYAKDYQLYSQSLILSRVQDGSEIEWKNLDKIWTLVGDKQEFIAYVQSAIADFVQPGEKK